MCVQYKVPFSYGTAEYDEKRSRFIGQIWNVNDEREAAERINQTRSEHREARHNVYAYLCRAANATGYSDDGEPKGTGGMPVLMLLRGMELTDVCCVVTRYFGGILLGTGGLARAYTEAAKRAAENAGAARLAEFSAFKLSFSYDKLDGIRKIAENLGGQAENILYGAEVGADIYIPSENAQTFSEQVTTFSSGAVTPETCGKQMKKGLTRIE